MKFRSFLILFIIFIGLIFGLKYYLDENKYKKELNKVPSILLERNIPFKVEEGLSATTIAKNLEKSGLITSSWAFLRHLDKQEGNPKLMAGKFVIQKGAKIDDVLNILTGKKQFLISITIPEGFTAKQIDKLLVKNKLITEGEFSDCIYKDGVCNLNIKNLDITPYNYEGFLFPATYYVSPIDFDVESFAQRLVDNLVSRMPPEWFPELAKKNISFYELIIMASMIEREAINDDERPIIAGILWKRLNNGWALGVDATSRYIQNNWTDELTKSDFEVNSRYNTRKFTGLPPGAISNPSINSIKAALYPTKTEYWYYLHDPTGQIHYAKTNEEHNKNKSIFLR